MSYVSRRQLASYVADQLLAGRNGVVDELAAYLVESHRTKEAELVVLDIESALASRGAVVAEVGSAHTLDSGAREAVGDLLKQSFHAKKVYLREIVEPELLGGVVVSTADHKFDGTLQRTLHQLKAVKV